MKTSSLIVIATGAFGLACSADPAGVEGGDVTSLGTNAESLTSNGWPLGWSALPNYANGLAASPAVARLFDDTIEVIARDAVTNTLHRSRKVGHAGAWSGWASLGNDTFAGKPVVIGLDEDFGTGLIAYARYVVFAKKSDNRFYSRYMSVNGGPLSGWVQVAPDTFASSPGVASAGRVMWVVGRKSNGGLYAASQTLGVAGEQYSPTGFGSFAALPAAPAGTQFAGDPAVSGASFWESGGPAFYSRLNDNRYATVIGYTNNTYSNWSPIGTTTFASDPAVTSSGIVARTTVYGRKLGNPSANRIVQSTGFFTAWEPFTEVKTDTFVETPAAVDGTYTYGGPSTGLVHHVVAKKSNNQLYLNSHVNTDPRFGPREACNEPHELRKKAGVFRMVVLPAGGALQLSLGDSITWDELKNVALDSTPPVLGTPNPPYIAGYADDAPPGQAPFLVPNMLPFDHSLFHNEFRVGGNKTYTAGDYALTKGFSYLTNWFRVLSEQGHLPAGTGWATSLGPTDWFKRHNVTPARWDLLADVDLLASLRADTKFLPGPPVETELELDIEPGIYRPEEIHEAPGYPTDPAEQAEFTARYYQGAIKVFTAPVQVARERGYQHVTIYGWAPWERRWGIGTVGADPATDAAWNTYGKQIYEHVDSIANSAYSHYWSPRNLAGSLADIDLNRAMIAQEAEKKPIRPYYWTAFHGGGGNSEWPWWQGQPVPTEEARAMTTMGYFAGIDGHIQWAYTGGNNFSMPPAIATDKVLMVRTPFTRSCQLPSNLGVGITFNRYDAIHVTNFSPTTGSVSFQPIDKSNPDKEGPSNPTCVMSSSELIPFLRADSEPLAGVFQGMALVKPFENTLRYGTLKVDVSAQLQHKDQLPVVRRVKRHGVHILVSNSPKAVYGGPAEEIVLQNFDGKPGRTLRIPADAETRVWVLTDASCY